MEKDAFFLSPAGLNWQMQSLDGAEPLPELGSGYLNINWDQTIDQSAQFESALSSLVSSPSSNPPAANAGESVVIRELIGRLGNICNSGEISSPSSRYNSCYSTPLNSPPKLKLPMAGNPSAPAGQLPFASDPGFAERAPRFSSYCGSGQLSRVSSSQSLKAPEESPASGWVPAGHGNAKKRKAVPKGKGKAASLSSSITAVSYPPKTAGEDALAKGRPVSEAMETEKDLIKLKPEEEDDAVKKKKKKKEDEESSKPPEPPKDYIHVRARRGQATDSHSLAERVRREKISERMKFLQDLVPGCNKVTGKAVMLDEIINYVQSLQRQVEFLSMKLATVNQRLDFNVENFCKDLLPPQAVYPLETPSSSFSFGNTTQGAPVNGLELPFPVNHRLQLPHLGGFPEASSQIGALWDDDLQTVVQMGFSQAQENVFSYQSFQGFLPTNHMKIEL